MNAASKTALSSQPARRDAHRRDELILEHMSLVTAIAAHIQRSVPVHIELDDLVHAGVMGSSTRPPNIGTTKKLRFRPTRNIASGELFSTACGSRIGPLAICASAISKWKRSRAN